MKPGDQVRMKNLKTEVDQILYTILDIEDNSIKLKHPEIDGYFIFSKEMIKEVICKK
tara:strand:+ start:108 stop:278 length:171 start_codon:yes stop_codon:yes gene_type:complete